MKTKIALAAAVALTLLGTPVAKAQTKLDKKAKNEVIDNLLKQLNDNYVFPEVAGEAAQKLLRYQKDGTYAKINDAKAFAETLHAQLRDITHDKHVSVRYSSNAVSSPTRDTVAQQKQAAEWQRHLIRMNLGLPKLDILEGNIGYFEVVGFGPVDKVGKTVSAAMTFLNNTDALIIDLRRNHGGEPELVQYLVSHFFDGAPVHINDLYFRPANRTDEFWTVPVEGLKYLNKPVYILTSGETFSGGEEFAYDMQQLKRATIVGEVTGGGANPGDIIDLGQGFSAFIPSGRAINPITKTNWEGLGVKPDVAIPAAEALKQAHILALKAVMDRTVNVEEKAYYQEHLASVQNR